MNAIELKNVSFCYDGYHDDVLKELNMIVHYGEIALLSGFSGEGKSTVLSILSGIIPNIVPGKVSGDIFINGENIFGKKISEICRNVGMVMQNADAQIIHQKVEDEIAFGCENFAFSIDKIKERVEEACQLMKLDKTWSTRNLSGGQKQRLITASTLAMEQKIIILDEPLANLDKISSLILMKSLQILAEKGYAVLIVEHRLDMVLPFVNSVWNIYGGKVNKIEDIQAYITSQAITIDDTCPKYYPLKEIFIIDDVNFKVKDKEILKNINFDVLKGERVVVLGENGCGKTTLMRLIARLNKPTSGKISQFIDEKLKQKKRGSKEWFKTVGVVYQNPNYQLFMPTVRQEVAFGSESAEKTEEILQLFGIAHLAERHPQALSEGEKRKVSIAAVIATNPQVLFLDEPTVGQDYAGLRDLVTILNKIHLKTGNTMVTITHDKRCAEALCDKAIIIDNGVVKVSGGKNVVINYFSTKDKI